MCSADGLKGVLTDREHAGIWEILREKQHPPYGPDFSEKRGGGEDQITLTSTQGQCKQNREGSGGRGMGSEGLV